MAVGENQFGNDVADRKGRNVGIAETDNMPGEIHRRYRAHPEEGVVRDGSLGRALFPLREQGIVGKVRVIARRTLVSFINSLKGRADQTACAGAVNAWYHEAERAQWQTPADVKQTHGTASIISSDRVVFNIKGNDYRLVTAIDYQRQIVFIKWIGSHREYDKIDARTVQYGN